MRFATFCCAPQRDSEAWPAWEALPGDAQFEMFRASARAVEDNPEFVVLTDETTPFSAAGLDTRILRRSIDFRELMLERTRSQAAFLRGHPFDAPVVFADTDMLLVDAISPVFEQDFDIALTVRPKTEMPINGGLILVNCKRPERVVAFFDDLLARMESTALVQWREWYGDQYGLVEMLADVDIRTNIGNVASSNGVKVLLLDAAVFNHSPRRRRPALGQDLRDIRLYHFKGGYRQYMPFFWNKRVKPRLLAPPGSRPLWVFDALNLELRRKRMKRAMERDKRRFSMK